jgi:hypothetical protein
MEANPPPGFFAATGSTVSKAPTMADIRKGSFDSQGWNHDTQRKRAGTRTSQEERVKPTRNSSAVVTPLEGGSEPFPAVTEEDMRERPSGEYVQPALGNQAHDKKADAGVQLRQSNSTVDKTNGSAAKQESEVCNKVIMTHLPLTITPVCERLHTTAEASLEALFCHRSERLLEVVSDTSGLPHNTLRFERCRMGRHAILTPL